MFKKMLLMALVFCCLNGAVSAALIYEDFTTMPSVTKTKTAGFNWVDAVLHSNNYSEPTAAWFGAGSGSGTAYASFIWDLGGDYDFYMGGAGVCTVQVARVATTSWIRAELFDDGVSKSFAQYDFSDFWTFHELALPLDGDETGIDTVQFTIYRYTGTSTSAVNVDDFLVVPEPLTAVMLLGGLGVSVIRRKRKA